MNKYLETKLKEIGEHINLLGYIRGGDEFYIDNDNFEVVTDKIRPVIRNNLNLTDTTLDIKKVYPYIKSIPEKEAIYRHNEKHIKACEDFLEELDDNTKTKYKQATDWLDINNVVKFLKTKKYFILNGVLCKIEKATVLKVSVIELKAVLNKEFGQTFQHDWTAEATTHIHKIREKATNELPEAPDLIEYYITNKLFTSHYEYCISYNKSIHGGV